MDHGDGRCPVYTTGFFTNQRFTLYPDLGQVWCMSKFERKDKGGILQVLLYADAAVVIILAEGTSELVGEIWAVEVRGP